MRSKFDLEKDLKQDFESDIENKTKAHSIHHDLMRTKIILDHAPLIKFITNQIINRLPSNVDQNDLFSAGLIGLIDAIDKYDPARDNKFKTYAEFRIRGAILDELRKQDWLPRSARENTKKERQAQVMLEHQLKRRPTQQEVADFLNISLDQYQTQKVQMNISLVNLDDLFNFKGEDEQTGAELLEKNWAQNPFTQLNNKRLQIVITKSLNELPQKQRIVLEMYYYHDLSLKEIGQHMGITESRISQLHTDGIRKMRKKLKDILTD